MKRKLLLIGREMLTIATITIAIFFVAIGYNKKEITTEDISVARSIKAIHLVSKYNKKEITTLYATSFADVIKYGSQMPVIFTGTMTGYGPDCEGCGGKTGCPPRQDVRNGNIYFNDQEYGKINIVATDSRIPCGSIIKIRKSTVGEEVTAIALDRGGAIKETKMDFLVNSEKESADKIGVQKVEYEIVRWGW